jgi:hypothetical protein
MGCWTAEDYGWPASLTALGICCPKSDDRGPEMLQIGRELRVGGLFADGLDPGNH